MSDPSSVPLKPLSQPPRATPNPVTLTEHGHARIDEYFWLKDRSSPEVLAYLQEENAYTETIMGPLKKYEQQIFKEIKNRLNPTDLSVPFRMGDYWYYTRFEKGLEYALYCRKKGELSSPEEIMLDGNALAQGHEYFSIGNWQVSTGQDILAFAVDTHGRRIYSLMFKNLQTGDLLTDRIPAVTGNMEWANDNRTVFYSRQDPDTLRSFQVYRHTLHEEPSQDVLVFEEKDETFSAYVSKSKSKKYLFISSHQTLSSEWQYVDAGTPCRAFHLFCGRERGHEYDVDHLGDRFYIRTNFHATNFRLMQASESDTTKANWQEVISHRDDIFFEGVELFQDYLVVEERRKGLIHLRILPKTNVGEHDLDFGEPTYFATLGDNHEADTPYLRFGYTSMTTPMTIYDYHMETKEKTLLKQEEVLGEFQISHYRTERVYASADDGTAIPISLVYREGFARDGRHPLLLYGYGSYGISMDASFSSSRLSLLDRGFVFALSHIRGGEELGRQWYEKGKLLHKMNTFTDFIACAEYLSKEGYGDPNRMYAMGGSAGGLLMGAVINLRPELFHGVVAQVPFVDVVTTMLDADIPLTTGEYDEWGDPHQQAFYHYMLSYSPYDNVRAQAYPHLLVTSGLHDSQVQYWEPTKWVAKLRATKIDTNRLLLKTNMDAGHSGASGRYKRYEETAMIYTFLLDLAGKLP